MTNINEPIDWRLTESHTRIIPALEGWCSTEKACAMAGLVLREKPAVSVEICSTSRARPTAPHELLQSLAAVNPR